MMTTARSWINENHTLIYFLAAQFIAIGGLAASGLAYFTRLEHRVSIMEERGAAYTVNRMDEMKLKISALEQKIDTNEDSIKLIRDIMTRELGKK